MRRQFLLEGVLVLSLLASSSYTVVAAPGVPSARPWVLPVALGAMAAGVLGLVLRSRDLGRWAGVAYCLAALAPNGLYAINILVFAAGVAALTGVAIDTKAQARK